MRPSTAHLSRTMRAGALAGLLTLANLTPASVIQAQSGPPPLTPFHGLIDHVSQTMWGSVPGGNSDSGVHAISGDGRYVVFSSGAWDLVPNDYNGMDDIFLRDRSTGATTRVNVAAFTGAEADGISQYAAISTNGRHIAFSSGASNLVSDDTNNHWDVFVRDLDANRTVRVSISSTGEQGDSDSYWPSISANGRYVAFVSAATTFAPNTVQYGPAQVYIHDRDTDENGIFDEPNGTMTRFISLGASGTEPANQMCVRPRVSADGRYVMFESDATNLDPGGYSNGQHHLYVYDRLNAQMSLIDRAVTGGPSSWGVSWQGSDMSDDGRFFTFTTISPDIVPFDMNWQSQVFLYDALAEPAAMRMRLVSRRTDGVVANGSSYYATLSADGRYVAFMTAAANLASPAPAAGNFGLVVRDGLDGSFTRVDVVDGGEGFDGQYTFNPSISADGTAIAFSSDAHNAINWFNFGSTHVFVATAFAASPASASYPQSGGVGSIEVNTTPVSGWSASTYESWITLMDGADYAAGPRTVQYFVSANGSGIVRDGSIRVGSTLVLIHQDGDGDATPPVITPIVTGDRTVDGWYITDATVSWTVSDPDSEITNQSYNCNVTTTIASDAIYAPVTCEATSHGGTSSVTVVIKRDTTPPTIAINVPLATIYQSGSYVHPAVVCSDYSGYSGLATCTVTQGSDPLDMTPGRHVFEVTATDRAFNTSTKSVEYFVGSDMCVTPSPAPAHLRGWWAFDGTMRDRITGWDAVAHLDPGTFQPAVAGQGWDNPSGTGWFNFLWAGPQNPADLAAGDGLTVAAWVYPQWQHGESGTIVNNPAQYRIARYPDGTLRWAFKTTAGFDWVNTGVQILGWRWSHVAVTYKNGVVRSYVNGRLVHSATLNGTLTTIPNPMMGVTFGGRNELTATLFGTLDDIMIFDDALSPNDIDGLALSGGGSICVPFTSNLALTVPPTIEYGTTFRVSARLTDSTGRPLQNRPLTITSAVTPGYVYNNVMTDANGSVTVQFPINGEMTLGDYPDAIAGTFAGDEAFTAADAHGSVTLVGTTPPITWPQPAAITYGTALSATQLNATSTFQGTFAYSPAAGTVLAAGTQTLSVTFTPTDTAHRAVRTVSNTIVVNKATPTVEISNAPVWYTGYQRPATVTIHGVGTAELNPFTVRYNGSTTAPTNAGAYALEVQYAGSANYEPVTATGTFVVNKATPIMPTLNDVGWTYDGQPWPGINVNIAGVHGDWLTPVITTYDGSPTSPTNAGVYTVAVRYDGSANYTAISRTFTLTMAKAVPYVTWPIINSSITYGTPLGGTQLNATSNVAGTFSYAPPAGTVLNAGTHPLTASFTPSDTANYDTRSISNTVYVNKAYPHLAWTWPANIVYGTPLGATQLNATADVPGTFVYDQPAGTVLNAGEQLLYATFTPDDLGNYNGGSRVGAVLIVARATPVLSWSAPADVVFGTALGASQLNATAGVPGTFVYSPAAGTVLNAGPHALTASFTPSDAGNYQTGSVSTILTVSKANAPVTWYQPADIVYGTPLNPAQLNATAPVPGTLTYSPPTGTILSAGVHTLNVTFTPDDSANYNGSSASVPFTVAKATPAVSWSSPADMVYGTALGAAELNATVNVPGTLAYSPAAESVLGAGSRTLSVVFTPNDAANYHGATASVTLNVTKAASTITWSTPADIAYGSALGTSQLNATANVPGAFTYSPGAGAILHAGPQPLAVTFTPTDAANYTGATTSVLLNVTKAASTITWPTPGDIVYGTALGASQLNATSNVAGSLSYLPTAGTVLSAGSQTLEVTFTPDDAANYTGAIVSITLNVTKAASTISWPAPAAIVYGTALGATQLNATASVSGTLTYSPAPGTILGAGSQTLAVTFTPTDAVNYTGATASVTLNVTKAASTITWPTPAAIVYGTALSATELNATASVPGALAYAPATGTILGAGSQTLAVTFTPTDAVNYTGATASVTLSVTKAASTITWPTPAAIVYGSALGATQLNATANVPGTFTYSPGAGIVLSAGSQTLSLTFTPGDTANYTGSSATRSLTVTRAPLTIVANNASKPYGAPLPGFSTTATGFVNGDSMASLTGSLSFATSATATSPVGSYPVTPQGLSSSNYTITFANGTLTVVRSTTATSVAASPNPDGLNQAVTFTALVSVVAPGAGLPTGIVQFYDGSVLLGSAALAGASASLTTSGLSAGSHTIAATFVGDGSFAPSSGSGGLTVNTAAASSTTAVTSSANPSVVGQNVTLTATVTAPGTLTGSVQFYDGSVLLATVPLSGTTARLTTAALALGGHAITARYLGNGTIPPSTSPAFAQDVRPSSANPRASTTALAASPSPATLGSTVALTATVTGSQNKAPTGQVTFMVNGFVIGQGTLTTTGSVTAATSFSTSTLPHGTHKIEAVYLGDTVFRASAKSISLIVN